MKKGILFDFNGTMFFDSPKHKEAWDVFSRKYRGRPVSEEEMDHMHGQTNKQIIQLLMGDMEESASKKLSEDKEAFYRECCMKDPDHLHLVPGLIDLLDSLKAQRIPMTICSASIEPNIAFFINTFHLEQWFSLDDIVYDDGLHQDKIDMFQDGAQRIHVPIENCVVIEDSLSGIHFANCCNVFKIIAITSEDKEEAYLKLPGVSQVIHDFRTMNVAALLQVCKNIEDDTCIL